jgi:hypothetical protein
MKIPQAIPKGNASQNEIAAKPFRKSIDILPLNLTFSGARPEAATPSPPLILYQDLSFPAQVSF